MRRAASPALTALFLAIGAAAVASDAPREMPPWRADPRFGTFKNGESLTDAEIQTNSAKNPYNPAPEKKVFWSDQSWDEMYAPQARITVDSRELSATKLAADQQRDR